MRLNIVLRDSNSLQELVNKQSIYTLALLWNLNLNKIQVQNSLQQKFKNFYLQIRSCGQISTKKALCSALYFQWNISGYLIYKHLPIIMKHHDKSQCTQKKYRTTSRWVARETWHYPAPIKIQREAHANHRDSSQERWSIQCECNILLNVSTRVF